MADQSRVAAASAEWRRIRRRLLREVRALSTAWSGHQTRPTHDPAPEWHEPIAADLRRWCYRTGGTGKGIWWPAFPPPQYLGQLDTAFQDMLMAQWSQITLDDCYFYHASNLSDGRTIPGPWDLRGSEQAYLGGVDIAGERVLELGPASGALTYFMEDEGAEVVSFDVGFDVCGDILPEPDLDPLEQRHDYMDNISRVQNSWWYLHRDRSSRAKIAYGDIYALPGDLGTFDTSVFGAILLHLRDPFAALQSAVAHTRRRIVITEPVQDLPMDDSLMRFAPSENLNGWWTFTPETIHLMLRRLGFGDFQTTFAEFKYFPGHDMTAEPTMQRMVTVVGTRT